MCHSTRITTYFSHGINHSFFSFFFLTILLSRMNFLLVVYDSIAFFFLFLLEIKLSSIDKLLSNCQWGRLDGTNKSCTRHFLRYIGSYSINNKGKKKLGQVEKQSKSKSLIVSFKVSRYGNQVALFYYSTKARGRKVKYLFLIYI